MSVVGSARWDQSRASLTAQREQRLADGPEVVEQGGEIRGLMVARIDRRWACWVGDVGIGEVLEHRQADERRRGNRTDLGHDLPQMLRSAYAEHLGKPAAAWADGRARPGLGPGTHLRY